MDTAYAEAIIRLEDAVNRAAERASRDGLTDAEICKEIRRIVDSVEKGD